MLGSGFFAVVGGVWSSFMTALMVLAAVFS